MNEYSPLSSHRWGFRCGKSTTAALLAATQDWLNSQDNKKDVCFVFFDLQKAFDKVPHHLLLAKLKQLQLHPIIMTWLHSYLYRREQFVVVNGKESVYVISGVPQGSVLGPRTTLLNDITHIHLSEGTRLCLYADDILCIRIS